MCWLGGTDRLKLLFPKQVWVSVITETLIAFHSENLRPTDTASVRWVDWRAEEAILNIDPAARGKGMVAYSVCKAEPITDGKWLSGSAHPPSLPYRSLVRSQGHLAALLGSQSPLVVPPAAVRALHTVCILSGHLIHHTFHQAREARTKGNRKFRAVAPESFTSPARY